MNFKSLLISGLMMVAPALAAKPVENPIVVKSNATGFTTVDGARFETCSVYANRLVIEKTFGGFGDQSFKTREIRRLRVSETVANVIARAENETLDNNGNFLCDAPSTEIKTVVDGRDVVLFSSGGCGSPRLERKGPATRMLVELINTYCPKTNDFSKGGIGLPLPRPIDPQ